MNRSPSASAAVADPAIPTSPRSLPVALIHGYKFDPEEPRHNPHVQLFDLWRSQLPERRVLPFAYYSAPGWRGHARALLRGHWNSYRWAYRKLAPAAAERLAGHRQLEGRRHDILCHSLGSRVALLAIDAGAAVRNCVILNGAELVRVAEAVARAHPHVRFVNIYAKADTVIDVAAEWFTPGARPNAPAIGNDGMDASLPNWTDVVLDDERVQAWARETHDWSLAGDDPRRISDHDFSYEWTGNWDLIRAALDGDRFDGLPVVG
jgi:hypothetical protein